MNSRPQLHDNTLHDLPIACPQTPYRYTNAIGRKIRPITGKTLAAGLHSRVAVHALGLFFSELTLMQAMSLGAAGNLVVIDSVLRRSGIRYFRGFMRLSGVPACLTKEDGDGRQCWKTIPLLGWLSMTTMKSFESVFRRLTTSPMHRTVFHFD